ncbi:hypothetical protein [Phenylobacterium sp. J367]|uniref:hypothetical protein n=1 Tax=Phenylobacterium sp. J367 TaxID=2898435 RepID=UPI00215127C0|nr:hypothetical protein [Phenylobacterium sp. J367]
MNAALPADDPQREYKPESLRDVELGVKADWRIGEVTGRTNLAAYKIWYSDIQTQTRFGGGITLVQVNGGEADFKGLEFETTINPSPWFSISGQLSYQRNRYTKYTETSFCRNQTWRQVPGGTCDGLPADTPINIDHAKGVLTIAPVGRPAQTYTFRPPRFNVPLTWSLRPEFRFEPWLGEEITAGFNIYRSEGETGLDFGPSNFAGVTPFVVQSWMGPQSGLDAYAYQPFTMVDFSADWRRIRGSNVSAYLRVTNLTKELYRVGSADTFVSGGTGAPSANEPRMALVGLKYDF